MSQVACEITHQKLECVSEAEFTSVRPNSLLSELSHAGGKKTTTTTTATTTTTTPAATTTAATATATAATAAALVLLANINHHCHVYQQENPA